MNEKLALHTAARRYCIDHAPWLNQEVREREHLSSLRRTRHDVWPFEQTGFPEDGRVILEDVLLRIEQARPENFPSTEALRAFLLVANLAVAQEVLAEQEEWDVSEDEVRAQLQVLDALRLYIERLSSADLATVEPLPMRRPLTEQEADAVWDRVKRAWGASPDSYWYPMLPPGVFPERSDVVAFDELAFLEAVPWTTLRSLLAEHGVRRVFELVHGSEGDEREMNIELLEVRQAGRGLSWETYWTAEPMDWLLYLSHEHSLTVAGEWLLEAVKRVWPSWETGLSYYETGPSPE